MLLEYGKFSPEIKLGLVSASRNCFPRELSERRSKALIAELKKIGISVFTPKGNCSIIESKADASEAARQFNEENCDAAVLYLGNFSPEIEDAAFVKDFEKPILLIAAAEENSKSISCARGDALCGLISASLAITKRGLDKRVCIPKNPLVSAKSGAQEIARFIQIARTLKGVKKSTIGLFGPRPRDFESCNYNISSLLSIGVEVEELGLFDLEDEVQKILKEDSASAKNIAQEMSKTKGMQEKDLLQRLSLYERALLNMRKEKNLSGAATQCWSRQEAHSKHVPCYVNSRLTQNGFPIACENDAYSLVSELICQYASDEAVTMLDINHTIPSDMLKTYPKISNQDVFGLFHCGNVPAKFMKDSAVKYQLIMSRLMEPNKKPDITRGTLEGAIKASPITILQLHGSGDKLRAYICEGSFLNADPKTFGSVGIAHVPGFMRFYRNCILGRFHHHAAVAFTHCGGVIFDTLKMLGIQEIYVPSSAPYPNENVF